MKIFLIELPLFLLLTGKGQKQFFISAVLYMLTCVLLMLLQRGREKITISLRYPFLSLLICTALGIFFWNNWNSSGRIQPLAAFLNKPPKQSCAILASFLAMASVFGVDYLLKSGMRIFKKEAAIDAPHFSSAQVHLYLFLTAFLIITLNSKCSPIYPINDWFDPNAMFTVGKGVLKGYVPYRDLYEQKGPLLIFLHTFGAAVNFTGFTGMWILEIIFCYAFLLFSWKTIRLFIKSSAFLITPVLTAIIYTSYSFRGGDSAEEFCLPLLAFGLYAVIKGCKNGTALSEKEYFLIGLTSGCVFWIKYSMVGFYLGWVLALFLISVIEKKLPQLIKGCLRIFLGVIVSSVPVAVYFAVNSSLYYLWEAYFYNNLFTYAITDIGWLRKVASGFASILETNGVSLILAAAGGVYMAYRRQWKPLITLLFTFAGLFLSVYSVGRFYPYYSLTFGVFAVYGLLILFEFIQRIPSLQEIVRNHICSLSSLMILLGIFLVSFFSYNLPFLEYEKEDLMQFKMKTVINNSGIKNPTLFYYKKYDAGITTVTGIIPNVRYFCSYNNKTLEEIDLAQDDYVRKGISDFVITRSGTTEDYPEFELYEHAGSFEGTIDWGLANYHYFVRKQK